MEAVNGIQGVQELIDYSEGVKALLYYFDQAKEYVLDEYIVEEVDGFDVDSGEVYRVSLGPTLRDALATVAGQGHVGVTSESQSSEEIWALIAEPFGFTLYEIYCFSRNDLAAEVRDGIREGCRKGVRGVPGS